MLVRQSMFPCFSDRLAMFLGESVSALHWRKIKMRKAIFVLLCLILIELFLRHVLKAFAFIILAIILGVFG